MKSLKRTSKIQTKIKTVLTQIISVGVAALVALFLIEAPASGFSGSGSGTVADPYQITNATQLQNMQDDLNAHYVLMNDIDCSDTVNWNGGAGFDPIGKVDDYPNNVFAGTFDGQNHTITGLYIYRPAVGETNIGLFGYTNDAEIKDVGMIDVDITGERYVGGLAGKNKGIIRNSYSTGNVSGRGQVGGLLGETDGGKVLNSYSTVSVSGSADMGGGLVGVSAGGTITNCYATGDVTMISIDAGGLVGYNSSSGTITNSYSTGSVTGSFNVGGLAGLNQGGTITNCYFTDFANNNGFGILELGGPSAFYGSSHAVYTANPPLWDFVNIWGIDEGVSYPYLLWQTPKVACSGFESPMDDGPVTLKKNRVLPLKAQLLDADGFPVTDVDIAALPVLQVLFDSGMGGDLVDVTDESLPAGQGTEGNEFVFTDGEQWQFNLKTKNYSAPGTYTITMESGDKSEYVINPTCEAVFVIE